MIGLIIIIIVAIAMILLRRKIARDGGPTANTMLRVGDAISSVRFVAAALLVGLFMLVAARR
mgnify:CR=1 FL=1